MSTLPSDILADILCRLSVDCVLLFRCVSKSWRSLIDTPQFAKLHLNHSLKTNSNLHVILREADYYEYGKRCFYSLNLDSLNSRVVTPKELKNPLKSSEFKTNILGSCNGLLLISNTVDDIALWNPSTGNYKRLPVRRISENNGQVKFGLGYDRVNDDYKVVRIVQFSGSEKGSFRSDVKIYSLRTNTWKRVEDFPYYLRYYDQPGTYFNGALHWVANTDKLVTNENLLMPLIVAFDLGTEKCRVVPHPPYTNTGFIIKLVVMGSSLCTCHTYFIAIYDGEDVEFVLDHLDVWEMKEYGVKNSWTKVMSLEEPDQCIGHTVVPIAYSKSREALLLEQDNRRFLWTSIKDKFVKSIDDDFVKIVDTEIGTLQGFLHFDSYVYLGSIVQLSSSDERSDLKKKYNQDKGGKAKILNKREDFLSTGFKLKL